MAELIYILLGLLLVGNVLTALFRWRDKRRSAANNEPPQHKTLLDVLSYCLAALDLFPIGIVVLVSFLFCLHWYDFLSYALAGLLVLGLLLGLMLGWFTKKRFLLWLVCALAVGAAIWGSDRYERYLREISMPDLYRYSCVCLENARDIFLVLEENYRKTYGRLLTMSRIGEVIEEPRYPETIQMDRDKLRQLPSVMLEDELEKIRRLMPAEARKGSRADRAEK